MMERKYMIDTKENMDFLTENAHLLLDFGRAFPSPSGASYYLSGDGTPFKDRPRETWITARMAHVYSIGAMLRITGCRELADAALQGLRGELKDTVSGGFYSGVDANGRALPRKMCYAHAFVILAAASGKLAGICEADDLLEEALRVFDRYFWDETEGLTYDAWDRDFHILDAYRGLNANMHTVEAYLAVADARKDEEPRKRAGRIIDGVIQFAGAHSYRIPEHYSEEWEPLLMLHRDKPADPFQPYGATPGHGIEWARLITQWAVSTFAGKESESELTDPYIEAACRLYERAVSDAWTADGRAGFVYTTDWDGVPVIHDRMHWTLAEAINTSAVLYHVTGNPKYADDYSEFLQYLDEAVIDHSSGSWYHQLDQKNRLADSVWQGKPDLYHAFQAMLIPYAPIHLSLASAAKEGFLCSIQRYDV